MKLKPVLDAFLQAKTLESPKTCKALFVFENEKFYDLKSYLNELSSTNNGIAENELKNFYDWIDNHLIIEKQINHTGPKALDESWLSGISIYIPSSKEELGRYDYLPFYKDTNFENLMRLTLQ